MEAADLGTQQRTDKAGLIVMLHDVSRGEGASHRRCASHSAGDLRAHGKSPFAFWKARQSVAVLGKLLRWKV